MTERPTTDSAIQDATSEEHERLILKHQKCEERLSELRSRLILTDQEKMEEVTLKKQKLLLKDRMEAIARGSAPKSG